MFTKEERLFIWKKVYEMIDRLEDGEYICVALRNVVFMYFKTHKNIYEFRSDEMVRIYFPELGKAEYCERYYKRIRIVFLLIYFIHQIKFWVLACRFVRIGMPISAS